MIYGEISVEEEYFKKERQRVLHKAMRKLQPSATDPYVTMFLTVNKWTSCLNMNEQTWLNCNIHMFEYFGGVTLRVICDNLKVGVVTHPHEGDAVPF